MAIVDVVERFVCGLAENVSGNLVCRLLTLVGGRTLNALSAVTCECGTPQSIGLSCPFHQLNVY